MFRVIRVMKYSRLNTYLIYEFHHCLPLKMIHMQNNYLEIVKLKFIETYPAKLFH